MNKKKGGKGFKNENSVNICIAMYNYMAAICDNQ